MHVASVLFAAAATSLASVQADQVALQSTNSTRSLVADKLCKKSFEKIAFAGSDLGQRTMDTTWEACVQACGSSPECIGVSWGHKNGACDLKKGKLVRVDNADVSSTTVRKMVAGETCATVAVFAENVDYYGGDITGAVPKVTADEVVCAQDCRANPGCVVFTWRKSDKMCFLKGTKAQVQPATGMWSGQVHATAVAA